MSQKKQIFKLNTLKNLLNDENSCVSLMKSTRLLALPPFFLNDMKSGILYLLNAMLKKYDRSLGGIVMGYQNIKVLMDENTGIIPIGTSETEVNISVEFYVFQPKIGSYLEGVINKKSNNHIGCLVHQYFNATILKPEDVLYEDWICKNFNVDDKIIFKVKDLDFTTLLPFIEGIYDGKNSLDKVRFKTSRTCDIDDVIVSDLCKSSQNEISISKEFLKSTINKDRKSNDFSGIKKSKNKHKQELTAANENFINDSGENGSLISLKSVKVKQKNKNKKKKEIKYLIDDIQKLNEENDKDVNTSSITKALQVEESSNKKRKKRKKIDNYGGLTVVENLEGDENKIFEKLVQLEDENSNDFVKVNSGKLKIKSTKCQNEDVLPNSNKTNECLPSQHVEDNILYSTQLDPVLDSKKLRISFCSPIQWSTPFKEKLDTTNASQYLEPSVRPNNQDEVVETENKVKKKHKKRRREKQEESDDSPASKKIKTSSTSKKKEEARQEDMDSRKSILQAMMAELFKDQLNNSPKIASCIEEKLKKEVKKKKKREKNESTGFNEEERKSEAKGTFNELYLQELQRVKEELSMSNKKESLKKNKKTKVKLYKQEALKEMAEEESCKVRNYPHAQISSTNGSGNKMDMKSVTKKLYKQEINRMKEHLNVSSIKEKKRKSGNTNDREASKEKTHLSLYDKLLNEAKSAIDVENSLELIKRPATESLKNKKDNELSDFSTSSSGRKNLKKKSQRKKQKAEDCQQICSKFRNGSMYNMEPTPEKINTDKSLFSDSEQSHASPVKRTKEVNGDEMNSRKCQVQNLLHEFVKEEMKRLKSESNSESLRNSEKNEKSPKGKEKIQISGEKEESLYEKLLRQAKSLVDGREVPPTKKKKKKSEGKKKQKSDTEFC